MPLGLGQVCQIHYRGSLDLGEHGAYPFLCAVIITSIKLNILCQVRFYMETRWGDIQQGFKSRSADMQERQASSQTVDIGREQRIL